MRREQPPQALDNNLVGVWPHCIIPQSAAKMIVPSASAKNVQPASFNRCGRDITFATERSGCNLGAVYSRVSKRFG